MSNEVQLLSIEQRLLLNKNLYNLVKKIDGLTGKDEKYKDYIKKIVELGLSDSKRYKVGVNINCTIYKENTALVYLLIHESGITARTEDQSGNKMSDFLLSHGFSVYSKTKAKKRNEKIHCFDVESSTDAQKLYEAILNPEQKTKVN